MKNDAITSNSGSAKSLGTWQVMVAGVALVVAASTLVIGFTVSSNRTLILSAIAGIALLATLVASFRPVKTSASASDLESIQVQV